MGRRQSDPGMLTAAAVKRWHAVHKWSSLISLLFMLAAFGSGLPLVFGEEIYRLEQWLVAEATDAEAGNETALSLDALISRARQERPGTALQLMYRDRIDPRVTYFALGKSVAAPLIESEFLRIDNFSGEYLGAEFYAEGVMGFFLLLHTQLFMGLGGMLLLGFIGLLFLLALLSGVVLYAPFMRQRSFAVIRLDKGRRGRWLDLHNSAGIVLLTWAFVVGATGVVNTVVNTVDNLLIHFWLQNDLQQITADDPVAANATGRLTSVQRALELSAEAMPDGEFNFMTFPGAEYSSDRHYLVFFNGVTPLSSQLLRVAVINAYSGELIATPAMPWYIIVPLLAQPLHYGNYGGIGLKIAWALLCLATIALLLSGLALWWQKRRDPPSLNRARRRPRHEREVADRQAPVAVARYVGRANAVWPAGCADPRWPVGLDWRRVSRYPGNPHDSVDHQGRQGRVIARHARPRQRAAPIPRA